MNMRKTRLRRGLNVSSNIAAAHSDPVLSSHSTEAEFDVESNSSPSESRRCLDKFAGQPSDWKDLLKRISQLFAASDEKQNMKFEQLNSTLGEIQAKSSKIDEAITFFSLKYDEILDRLDSSERANTSLKRQVCDLESKVEVLERQSRASTIEIKNLPLSDQENKDSLIANVCKIGTVIDEPIKQDDIKNIFRTKHQSASPIPSAVFVEFKSVTQKENVIKSARVYNKTHKDTKLSTAAIQYPGPTRPLYISESLTSNSRHVFYLARKLHKDGKIDSCWTNNGRIFIKKTAASSPTCVNTEQELSKILPSFQ